MSKRPPWGGCLLRFGSRVLVLLLLGLPVSAEASTGTAWAGSSGVTGGPCARAIREGQPHGPGSPFLLAERRETVDSIQYGAGPTARESDLKKREQFEQEERSWQMLDNLNIYPQGKRKPSPPTNPAKPPRKQPYSAP